MKSERELIQSFSNEQRTLYLAVTIKKELTNYLLLIVAMIAGVPIGYLANCL